MKVRYPIECPFCHTTMQIGTTGTRFRGLIWHPRCIRDYEKSRQPALTAR